MILEFLNIALFCFGFFILTVVFSLFRTSKNIIFDNKNFSKNFFQNLFIGNTNVIKIKKLLRYVGILFLIIAISGIKTGVTVKPVERKGVDIIFFLMFH